MNRKSKRRKQHQDSKRRRAARRGAPQKVALRNGAPQKGLARNGTTRNGGVPRHSPNGERRNQLSIVATSDHHLFPAAGLAPGGLHASSVRLGPFPIAPRTASSRILDLTDELAVGDALATYEPDLREGLYREIRFGELLNYTRDPLLVLRRAREWLAPGGAITATFANARHASVVASLLAGDWRPDSQTPTPNAQRLAPTNDNGHFPPSTDPLLPSSCPPPSSFIPHPSSFASTRFYTRREIEKLFYRAGYVLRELRAEQNPDLERWRSESRPVEIVLGSLRISAQSPEEAEEFITERYQALAAPAKGTEDRLQGTVDRGQEESAGLGSRNVERKGNGQMTTDHGLTSIVIVTFSQLAFTRMCLESIRFRTDEPYELIVVDNGSTDGTIEYLRACGDVKLIENADNRGFPAAANQGILASRGRQILLLNNDVIVTTGWLRRMLDALDASPLPPPYNLSPVTCNLPTGLVGPCSNAVGSTQQVEIGYDDLASLDGFAWDWGRRHHAQRDEVERLVGFCLLFRRELVDRVGVLDERFGVGNFEDDDFCLRAKQAGYRVVIARDTFIHHFGHRTFAGAGIDLSALMVKNEQVFQEKWRERVIGHSSFVLGHWRRTRLRCPRRLCRERRPWRSG